MKPAQAQCTVCHYRGGRQNGDSLPSSLPPSFSLSLSLTSVPMLPVFPFTNIELTVWYFKEIWNYGREKTLPSVFNQHLSVCVMFSQQPYNAFLHSWVTTGTSWEFSIITKTPYKVWGRRARGCHVIYLLPLLPCILVIHVASKTASFNNYYLLALIFYSFLLELQVYVHSPWSIGCWKLTY